jgi:hypothetical protein
VESFETPFLLFASDAFSVGGDAASSPLGKDAAEFFGAQLTAHGVQVNSLVEATDGWELEVNIESLRFLLFVHWIPIDAENHWILQIRQPRKALLGFQRQDNKLEIAFQTISEAIADRQEIKVARWLTEAEFRAIY